MYLDEPYAQWAGSLAAKDYRGFLVRMRAQVVSHNDRRMVQSFHWKGRRYFFKWHLQACDSALGMREAQWIERLRALGLRGPHVAAAGDSFLITEAVAGSISIEQLLLSQAPHPRLPRVLLEKVAGALATLHCHRIVHKDLYWGHLFWNPSTQAVTFIDLARAKRHGFFFWRWRIKDLASLCFSSALLNLSRRDKIGLFFAYRGIRSFRWRDTLMAFLVMRKARRIAHHTQRSLHRRKGVWEPTPHNDAHAIAGVAERLMGNGGFP